MNRELVRAALRAPLLTMVVASTGVISLEATADGYAAAPGTFLPTTFAIGMEVMPNGFAQAQPGVVASFSDSEMLINGGRDVEASASGRSLTVGLPSMRAWDADFEELVGTPFVEDELAAGPRTRDAIGDSEEDHTGMYYVRPYCVAGVGDEAIDRYTAAILACYPIGLAQTLADGSVLRIRGYDIGRDVAPSASGSPLDYNTSWRVLPVHVPFRLTVTPL